jgi:hypothetical protein
MRKSLTLVAISLGLIVVCFLGSNRLARAGGKTASSMAYRAKMPSEYLAIRSKDLDVGQVAWVPIGSVAVTKERIAGVFSEAEIRSSADGVYCLKIQRVAEGFRVDVSGIPPEKRRWTARDELESYWISVVDWGEIK